MQVLSSHGREFSLLLNHLRYDILTSNLPHRLGDIGITFCHIEVTFNSCFERCIDYRHTTFINIPLLWDFVNEHLLTFMKPAFIVLISSRANLKS